MCAAAVLSRCRAGGSEGGVHSLDTESQRQHHNRQSIILKITPNQAASNRIAYPHWSSPRAGASGKKEALPPTDTALEAKDGGRKGLSVHGWSQAVAVSKGLPVTVDAETSRIYVSRL